MLKVHILARRRSDMTHEQYVAYWRDVHAPLFASQPDVQRYVRHYIRTEIYRSEEVRILLFGRTCRNKISS